MILNHIDDGEGHVIVLLHGMFGSHTNLNNIARFLSSNYRVLNCDLRNQGDSFHNDTMDLTSMANDVVRLLVGTLSSVGSTDVTAAITLCFFCFP